MQICIVDNSTEEIDWNDILQGIDLKRVEVFRQPESVPGYINWNTCIRLSRGHLIHILHDDDWVDNGFYAEIDRMYREAPNAGLFAVRSFHVNESGVIMGVGQNCDQEGQLSWNPDHLFPLPAIQCVATVAPRARYEELGGFRDGIGFVLDAEMWLRLTIRYGARYSPHVLAFCRGSFDNGTQGLLASGDNFRDLENYCRIALKEYPSLQHSNYRMKLLDYADSQEQLHLRTGNVASVKLARQMWASNATTYMLFKRRISNCLEFIESVLIPKSMR